MGAQGLSPRRSNQAPEVIGRTLPAYSAEALRMRLQGRVTLAAEIAIDGTAQNIRVIHGLGAGLDERASDCLRQWTFRPALGPLGTPVRAQVTIEIVFSLEDST